MARKKRSGKEGKERAKGEEKEDDSFNCVTTCHQQIMVLNF